MKLTDKESVMEWASGVGVNGLAVRPDVLIHSYHG